MELFDVLPERFFGLLAGKCRRIYAEAGLCLYEQYRLAQFGIEQEILRDKFQELIESWAEAGVAYEDDVFSEKDNAIEESRAKASQYGIIYVFRKSERSAMPESVSPSV